MTITYHDTFTMSGELHVIASGNKALSDDADPALDSAGYANLVMLNFGTISNDVGAGLRFTQGSTGTIVNELGGTIEGGLSAVAIAGSSVKLFNYGDIHADSYQSSVGIYLGPLSSSIQITNEGTIHGHASGILSDSRAGQNYIVNNGTIAGGAYGISFNRLPGSALEVYNKGEIDGGVAAIHTASSGRLYLNNGGIVKGDIVLEIDQRPRLRHHRELWRNDHGRRQAR